jgi:hypothetical protein
VFSPRSAKPPMSGTKIFITLELGPNSIIFFRLILLD